MHFYLHACVNSWISRLAGGRDDVYSNWEACRMSHRCALCRGMGLEMMGGG